MNIFQKQECYDAMRRAVWAAAYGAACAQLCIRNKANGYGDAGVSEEAWGIADKAVEELDTLPERMCWTDEDISWL